MHGKKKFLKDIKVSWWKRICQGKKYAGKKFKNTWLDVKKAPEPDVIIWQNQHISKTNRAIRTGIVALITIFLLGVSFGSIIVSKYYQDVASQKFDISNCGTAEITKDEAYADYQRPEDRQVGRLGCYCFA